MKTRKLFFLGVMAVSFNANASMDYDYSVYTNSFKKTENTKKYDQNELFTSLKIKNEFDISDEIQFNSSIIALYSSSAQNQNGVFTANNLSNTIPYVDIAKMYVTFFGKNIDIYLGKKEIKVGKAELYSPSDIFGKSIIVTPQHSEQVGEYTLSADYYLNDDKISMSLFPTNIHYGKPDKKSRWYQDGKDYDFFSDSISSTSLIYEENKDSSIDNWGFLAEYSAMIDNLEYYTYVSKKEALYPVLKKRGINTYEKIYPNVVFLAFGLLQVVEENKYYMDLIYQHTLNNLDQDYVNYTIGFKHRQTDYAKYLNLEEVALITEYAGQMIADDKYSSDIDQNSNASRINKNNVILSVEFKKDANLSYRYSYNTSMEKNDSSQNHTIKYNYNDNTTFYVSAYFYQGSEGTFFGRWEENDNLELGFNYKF